MTRKCLVCLALCLVGGMSGAWAVSTRAGDVVHCRSKTHRFYLTVPGEWRKVTQSQMDAFKVSIESDIEEYEFDCVAAYGQDFVVGEPTATIGVIVWCYDDNRQITDRHIRQMVRSLTGADLDDVKRMTRRAYGRDHAPPGVRSLRTRDVTYSDERKRLIWDIEVELIEGSTVRRQVYAYFGKRSAVMVIGTAPLGQFDKCGLGLTGADQTFSFEPGAEFQETEWYKSHWFAIGLIAVATSLLAYIFRQRKH